MERRKIVFDYLDKLGIKYECYEHPEAPTVEIAMQYWENIPNATHCKNLFFRNHKGNRHYLVVFECSRNIAIHDLEKRLNQGKLSFASDTRMERYLGLRPGSVSPFGLINDVENHTYLFLDTNLQKAERLSFHPNDNTASVVISKDDFMKYLTACGNEYKFTELY